MLIKPRPRIALLSGLLLGVLLVQGAARAEEPNTQVRVTTNMGEFVIELRADRAPLTVANFLRHAVTNQFGGHISGNFGITTDTGAVTVVNSGDVTATVKGVYLRGGGGVTNASNAHISGYFAVSANFNHFDGTPVASPGIPPADGALKSKGDR